MLTLNLGCGDDIHPDAINIDLRPVGDVVADVRNLPYSEASVDELRALDVLEHFSEYDMPLALSEWARVLRSGGKLVVRVPNLHALCVQIAARADTPTGALGALIRNVYGGHKFGDDGELDCHHFGFTPASLAATLDQHGFDVTGNDGSLNMRVEAVRR